MVSFQHITIPLIFKFQQRQKIFIQFWQQREVFINTDTRHFKIQTSDMGPPPPLPGRASLHCGFKLVSLTVLQDFLLLFVTFDISLMLFETNLFDTKL